jgi:hypothetical protein
MLQVRAHPDCRGAKFCKPASGCLVLIVDREFVAMAGIANKVRVFNEAYKLAWDQLMQDAELSAKPSGLAVRLRDNIQMMIKGGSTEPRIIAVEAIAKMKS